MAIVFVEPFEEWNNNATLLGSYWTFYDSTGKSLQTGRLGGSTRSLRLTTENNCSQDLGGNRATVGVSFWYKPTPGNGVNVVCSFDDGASIQCCVRIDATGRLGFYRGASTVLATASNPLLGGTWYHVEAIITIHNTAGAYEVRVNRSASGQGIPAASSVNTRTTANNYATRAGFVNTGAGFSAYTREYDDVIFYETAGAAPNTWLGDKRLEWKQPDADDSVQWSPGSNNYDKVNDSPPDDSNYASDPTVGHRDTYTVADTTAVNVSHVTALHRCFKSGSGAMSIKRVLKSGAATDVESSAVALGTTATVLAKHYPLNPDGNVAWTPTTANAAKVGQEVA